MEKMVKNVGFGQNVRNYTLSKEQSIRNNQ